MALMVRDEGIVEKHGHTALGGLERADVSLQDEVWQVGALDRLSGLRRWALPIWPDWPPDTGGARKRLPISGPWIIRSSRPCPMDSVKRSARDASGRLSAPGPGFKPGRKGPLFSNVCAILVSSVVVARGSWVAGPLGSHHTRRNVTRMHIILV